MQTNTWGPKRKAEVVATTTNMKKGAPMRISHTLCPSFNSRIMTRRSRRIRFLNSFERSWARGLSLYLLQWMEMYSTYKYLWSEDLNLGMQVLYCTPYGVLYSTSATMVDGLKQGNTKYRTSAQYKVRVRDCTYILRGYRTVAVRK